MNILFIGDVVGRPGRNYLSMNLNRLVEENNIDFIIINGENSAGGVGITKGTYDELINMGADIITLGNHSWAKKEVFEFIEDAERLIRPANYPEGTPGKGYRIAEKSGKRIAVIIIDSHGRSWRKGVVGVTIGVSGLSPLLDRRGYKDRFGYELKVTEIGTADELASAASILMGQADEGRPVVVVRGYPYPLRDGSISEIIRNEEDDLFR